MSAVLPSNYFTAGLNFPGGVSVRIEATTMAAVAEIVARLQPAANDAPQVAPAVPAKAEAPKAPPAPAVTPAPTPASAPPAASGSAPAVETARPTYDDVRNRVLALGKKNRALATETLAKFGVDHGNKLKLEQYPEFIATADAMLEARDV